MLLSDGIIVQHKLKIIRGWNYGKFREELELIIGINKNIFQINDTNRDFRSKSKIHNHRSMEERSNLL
jgi:hypothetical protein